MELTQTVDRIIAEFPAIVQAALRQSPFLISAYIGEQMQRTGNPNGAIPFAPSTSKQLALGKGNLFRSFIPRDKNNILNISGTSVEFGSSLPYAAIHEEGGKVYAKTKVSSRKKKKETYVMAQYFWYMHKKTASPYYKYLALKVDRDGYISIPQRAYLKPALDKFEKEGFEQILTFIMTPLQRIFDGK